MTGTTILFREFPFDQLDQLAPLVSRAYSITEYDARAKIRQGWGFLERDIPASEAEGIAAALAPWVFVIDNDQLRQPAEPIVITGYSADESGFVCQPSGRYVPWSEVTVLASAGFTEDVIRREAVNCGPNPARMLMGLGIFAVTGLPVGLLGGGRNTKNEKSARATNWITFGRIITAQGEQFAFQPDHFDFSALGPLKQLNAAGNLRALLADWQQRTSARINLGARLSLESKSMFQANYRTIGNFETELLWIYNAGRGTHLS